MKYIRRKKDTEDVIINNHIFSRTYELYNNGSCQCNKDCDCIQSQGVHDTFILFKHNMSRERFGSLPACENDYRKCSINNMQRIADYVLSQCWFNTLRTKEKRQLIHKFIQSHNQYRKMHYHRFINNSHLINLLYKENNN